MSLPADSPSCSCSRCVRMCQGVPGWPTPEEAQKLIDEGYGKRLMADIWFRTAEGLPNIFVLAPAAQGLESNVSGINNWRQGCALLEEGKCTIYGLRPVECRIAHHDNVLNPDYDNVHRDVALLWDNEEAQALVWRWAKEVGG